MRIGFGFDKPGSRKGFHEKILDFAVSQHFADQFAWLHAAGSIPKRLLAARLMVMMRSSESTAITPSIMLDSIASSSFRCAVIPVMVSCSVRAMSLSDSGELIGLFVAG